MDVIGFLKKLKVAVEKGVEKGDWFGEERNRKMHQARNESVKGATDAAKKGYDKGKE